MEKLRADASELMICAGQLKGVLNHLGMVEANIEKRSRELDLKEKELQILSSDLEQKSQTFEAEKSEAGDLKKLVEECTEELRSKRNMLTAKLDSLTWVQRELESKDNQLGQIMARNVQECKRKMEDETARKKKELSLIVDQIQESDKQLEKRSREVELKEKEIEEKGKELDLVKSQVKAWEKKLIQLRKLVDDDCTPELSPRKNHVDSSNNTHVEVELQKKELGQTKTVLVEEENHGLSLPLKVVMSSSDVDSTNEPKHPPLFYTYQEKESLKDSDETEEKLTQRRHY